MSTYKITVDGRTLFIDGDFDLDAPRVAIVGSRASTAYGDHIASALAQDLARRGVVVVSGGAYGIDAAAHRGALAGQGQTVAVMAGGLDSMLPLGNRSLFLEIMDGSGAVVSEKPWGTRVTRNLFLERNGVIAHLATHGLIVVEASARSGSLNAARQAREMGRDVYATPGPVTSIQSEGTNGLLSDGLAHLVTGAGDIRALRPDHQTAEESAPTP